MVIKPSLAHGQAFAFHDEYVFSVQPHRRWRSSLLTIHPKTGRLVRESSVPWRDDYPPKAVARFLAKEYGRNARERAVTLGAWEAAMLLEEEPWVSINA